MLPAWATVAIAAISAAAGIAGGWLATKMRIDFDRDENAMGRAHDREQQTQRLEHETAEEWRDRRVRAADDFSTGIEQTILGVRDVIDVPSLGPGPPAKDSEDREKEAKRRLHEAVARVARIKLLFGEDSQPALIAKDLLPELDLALGAATQYKTTLAWEKLEKVYELHGAFNNAALEVIQQTD